MTDIKLLTISTLIITALIIFVATIQIHQVENSLDLVKSAVQKNAVAIKHISDCQRLLNWSGVNKTNFFSANGKHFYFNTTWVTWYKTRDWCAERGMQPATLKNLTQMEAVDKELNNRGLNGHGFWLSGSNIGRTPNQFQWADGTPVDNSTWYSGQPDHFGAGKETCVYLHTGYKLWDLTCSGFWYML